MSDKHDHRRDDEGNETDHHRIEDTNLGKLAYNYPMIAGAIMVLISVGGYLATLRYANDRITVVEARMDKGDAATLVTAKLLERISVLQEATDRRVTRLENNQDISRYHRGGDR